MYEQRTVSSSLINCMWRAIPDRNGEYSDPANEYWSIGFARHGDGSLSADLYGPAIAPRILQGYKGEEYWGVEFHAHVTFKGLDKENVLNSQTSLHIADGLVWLLGYCYHIPSFDELEVFVTQLESDGALISDQRIFRAINGDSAGYSERSRQRHFKNVTGLRKKQIEQLQRARRAFYLLQNGNSFTEAAHAAGYADQSHMTRSLKLLRGETPAQIIAAYLKASR